MTEGTAGGLANLETVSGRRISFGRDPIEELRVHRAEADRRSRSHHPLIAKEVITREKVAFLRILLQLLHEEPLLKPGVFNDHQIE